MLKRLIQFIKTAGSKTESDSDRDGFLSHSAETHALSIGAYEGFKQVKPRGLSDSALANEDVQAEPHYARAGYVVGYLGRVVILVALYLLGANAGVI